MKRKSFLVLSGVGFLALSVGGYFGLRSYRNRRGILYRPESLSAFCDDTSLCAMGKEYLQIHPEEKDVKTLMGLMGASFYAQEATIRARLRDNIKYDFESDRALVLDGWVVSRTEGRQCALFTLMQKE